MDIRADGPYEVGSLLFLSPERTWVFMVVAKVTFRLEPEMSPVISEGRDPVLSRDIPWGDGPGWSLRACSDILPFKQSPELLLSGSAYSPGGKPVRAAMVRLAFGAVDKTIEVQGDRYFTADGQLSDATPWTRMPLVWERAAGGAGTINPVGIPTGRAAVADPLGRTVVPNLWPPWTSISGPEEDLRPVGFGPLSPDWPERIGRLTSGIAWERPLPADFDGAYFNAAPADQRLAEITLAETLVLEHLHPRHARLVTKLEKVAPAAVIESPGHAAFTVDLGADTLWIDTDRGLATVTFRGHAKIPSPVMPCTCVVRPRERAAPPAATPLVPQTPDVARTPVLMQPAGAAKTEDDDLDDRPTPQPPMTLAQALHAKMQPPPGATVAETPKETPFVPPPTEASEPAQPPLWSGKQQQRSEDGADEAPDTSPTPHVPEIPEAPAEPEGPPPLPIDAYPLARCASIAASIDARPHEKEQILKKAELDEDTWERLTGHHSAAVDKELRRQGNKLLREYDAAYVARIEEERGPVAASEYARLSAAAEVGEMGPVLDDLRVPAAAWIRIRRVWISLLAKDRKLAALVQGFLDEERGR